MKGGITMKKTVLFNELNLRYPESFDVMSGEELGKVFSCRAERWGIKNLEQHMMFSVTRSGGKGILSRITDSKAVASGAGHQMKKTLIDYKKVYNIDQIICGQRARGFGFSFMPINSDVRQMGELIVFKRQNHYYSAIFQSPEEIFPSVRGVLEDILDSFEPAA